MHNDEIRNCVIRWKDSGEESCVNIAIGDVIFTRHDRIFFHSENHEEFNLLFKEDNGEDFVVIRDNSSYDIPFMSIDQDDIDSIGGRTLTHFEFTKLSKAISDLIMESFSELLSDAMLDTGLSNPNSK